MRCGTKVPYPDNYCAAARQNPMFIYLFNVSNLRFLIFLLRGCRSFPCVLVKGARQVGDRGTFLSLMKSAAARTEQQLVYSDIARDADVSVNTAKR